MGQPPVHWLLASGVALAMAATAPAAGQADESATGFVKSDGINPRYLPIYASLEPDVSTWGVKVDVLEDRPLRPGEDANTVVLDIFRKRCLEAFAQTRPALRRTPVAVLDPRLPSIQGSAHIQYQGLPYTAARTFCVPGGTDKSKIFEAMKAKPPVFNSNRVYQVRWPRTCGGLVPQLRDAHPGLEAGVEDRQGSIQHCWVSAMGGDYEVVLRAVQTILEQTGKPISRNDAVIDGGFLKQAAFEVGKDADKITVLVSGPRLDVVNGPKVEVNVIPIRFVPNR